MPVHRMLSRLVVLIIDVLGLHPFPARQQLLHLPPQLNQCCRAPVGLEFSATLSITLILFSQPDSMENIHEGFRPSVVGGGVGVSCIGVLDKWGFSFPAEEITFIECPGFRQSLAKEGMCLGQR
ncbi:hypothetical protein FB451DRAFT_1312664 [Mycena latifolia]|nr:hypothetical protein FB451DRAFT_1312664 [Mycena latifolia]